MYLHLGAYLCTSRNTTRPCCNVSPRRRLPSRPACFVTPQTVAGVSAVVKLPTSSNNGSSCDFADRAGGHAWFANANSAPGGIALIRSTSAPTSLAFPSASVLPGMSSTTGLSVAGGHIVGDGVGGLILGGARGLNVQLGDVVQNDTNR